MGTITLLVFALLAWIGVTSQTQAGSEAPDYEPTPPPTQCLPDLQEICEIVPDPDDPPPVDPDDILPDGPPPPEPTGTPVSEVAPHTGPTVPPITSPVDALKADNTTIAAQLGRTVADTAQFTADHRRFSELLVYLAQNWEATFGGGWSVENPDFAFFVRFVGAVPPEAETKATELGIDVSFLDDGELSQKGLEVASTRLHDALLALGSQEVVTSYWIEGQEVEATATPPPGLEDLTTSELIALLPEEVREGRVSIEFIAGPIGTDDHTFGGGRMLNNGSFRCTAGFVVYSGGTRGITTAWHCSGIDQYEEPGGIAYSSSRQGEHRDEYGDVEWHTTSHDEYAEFFADVDDRRAVLSQEASFGLSEGEPICGFGWATGDRKCSQVYRVYVEKTDNQGFRLKRLGA
ncbi:MAG: hypothetical protein WEB00_02330 [Dehalococcoidia bacterium]